VGIGVVGFLVGSLVGFLVGCFVGDIVGFFVGDAVTPSTHIHINLNGGVVAQLKLANDFQFES
jgi:hypothetical protein